MKSITTIITLYIRSIAILYLSIPLLFFAAIVATSIFPDKGLILLFPFLYIIRILPITYFGIPSEKSDFGPESPSEGLGILLLIVLAIESIIAFRSANEIRKGRRRGLIIYSFVVLSLLVGGALDLGLNGELPLASEEGTYRIVMAFSFLLSVAILWSVYLKRQNEIRS